MPEGRRRVAVTGLGVVCALGDNAPEFWDNCLRARSSAEPIPEGWLRFSNYRSRVWSPLSDERLECAQVSAVERKQLDPAAILIVKAAFEAVANAGIAFGLADEKRNTYALEHLDPERTAVLVGTGMGGVTTLSLCNAYRILERPREELAEMAAAAGRDPAEAARLREITGRMIMPSRFNPFAVSMVMPNACSAQVGLKLGIKGLNWTLNAACASGTIALGHAFRAVRDGYADAAITGGVEYVHDDYGALFYAFDVLKTLAVDRGDPGTANRPFDKARSGFLFSQGGAAAFVLEEYSRARDRGAPVLAEVAGFAETNDAHSVMVMEPDGRQIRRMLREALADSGCAARQIDYINAHGTGTALNDEVESEVIEEAFGRRPLVNSTKSLIGHTLGAAGAIGAAATVLSLRDGVTHASVNLTDAVRELNFARETVRRPLRVAISQSFGFGGHNACLVLRRPD
jgi:3-oxoacyl-[acyl-carrier-protein] synthase II